MAARQGAIINAMSTKQKLIAIKTSQMRKENEKKPNKRLRDTFTATNATMTTIGLVNSLKTYCQSLIS